MEYLNNLSKNTIQPISHTTLKQPSHVYENVHLTLPKELQENDVTNSLSFPIQEPIQQNVPISKTRISKIWTMKNLFITFLENGVIKHNEFILDYLNHL